MNVFTSAGDQPVTKADTLKPLVTITCDIALVQPTMGEPMAYDFQTNVPYYGGLLITMKSYSPDLDSNPDRCDESQTC